LGSVRFSGIFAWLIWVFVHIAYLIEFDNKLLVLIQWAWSYFTRNRGVRLIIGDESLPLVEPNEESLRSVLKRRAKARSRAG
jgi:NADH dehydrogenase